MKKIFLFIAISFMLISCDSPVVKTFDIDVYEQLLNTDNIKETLTELTSAKYDGRASGSEGNVLAATYITNKLASYGVSPMDNGSYLKEYQQSDTRYFDKDHYFTMSVGEATNKQNYRYCYDLDFIPYNSREEFALTSTILEYSTAVTDYSNKAVLVDYSKISKATSSALMLIYNYPDASFPNIEYGSGEYFSQNTTISNRIMISNEAKNKIVEQINNGNNSFNIDYQVHIASKKVNNIIGVLDNNKEQWVIISSHYDHVGRFDSLDDGYYPGALDNASGVASMLEISRILALYKSQLKYNYMFLSFNGEEAGLYGSKAYVENPYVALSKVKAQYNIDMVGGGSNDYNLEIPGYITTEYQKAISDSTKKYGITNYKIMNNAMDSDHYYFGQKRIPAMTFCHFDDRYYHRPGDSEDKINYSIMKIQLNMIGNIFLSK